MIRVFSLLMILMCLSACGVKGPLSRPNTQSSTTIDYSIKAS